MFFKRVFCFLFFLTIVLSASFCCAEEHAFYCYDVSKHGQIRYQYFVIGASGRVIEDGYEWRFAPKSQYVTDKILALTFLSGPNVTYTRFYHLKDELISPTYSNVIMATEHFCIYTDLADNGKWFILIASLFDNEIAVKYEIDLAPADGSIEAIEWSAENNGFRVTYISNDDYQLKTETILLP